MSVHFDITKYYHNKKYKNKGPGKKGIYGPGFKCSFYIFTLVPKMVYKKEENTVKQVSKYKTEEKGKYCK